MHNLDPLNKFSIQANSNKESVSNVKDIELSDIKFLFATDKPESERSTFEETFKKKDVAESEQGSKFLKGLIDNKETVMKKLGLSDEKYDSLACVALALSSQETGMGEEKGYVSENKGIKGVGRKIAKWFDSKILKHGSASSGLTQMKINDFMKSGSFPQEYKDLLNELGVETKGVSSNNLFKEPDKAAAATVVVLASLVDNYSNYTDLLSEKHQEIAENLNDGLNGTERYNKGKEILNKFSSLYDKANDETKREIRSVFKDWLLAKNDSKIGDKIDDKYNEEYQLKKLNDLLGKNDSSFSLDQKDLDYIRYALTHGSEKMSVVEYCAYAWNKGTGETGMQLDRLLTDKIGTILSTPDDFDYDQFTVNVSNLTQKYARQTVDTNVDLYLNNNLLE